MKFLQLFSDIPIAKPISTAYIPNLDIVILNIFARLTL